MPDSVFLTAARYLLGSGIVGLIGLLLLFPYHPISWLGAILWFFGALPVFAVFEILDGIFINNNMSGNTGNAGRNLRIRQFAYRALMVLLIWAVAYGVNQAGAIQGASGATTSQTIGRFSRPDP